MQTPPPPINKPAPKQGFYVLIAAAGQGQRLGSETAKQYLTIAGKPILRYSLECFLSHPLCKGARVIIDPKDAKLYANSVIGLDLQGAIAGAETRQRSVFMGLKAFAGLKSDDILLIHDAARPCLQHADIDHLLEAFSTHRAASLALPITSTLRKSNADQVAGVVIDRDSLWAMQTPQAFYYGDLLRAHESAEPDENSPDDTSLISKSGIDVKLVLGNAQNIKITYPEDLIMAEKILQTERRTVTGLGFDVHAFDKTSIGPVRLCGVDVTHNHKLAGHSDADVGLHALTDALLGAIGEGDIGRHFPPSDNAFKDMDSAVFLEHAIKIMQGKNGSLNNIDLTLICEEPKITPHAAVMCARIAEITGLAPERINVKATTTEQLGFTGRKEGIAAQAIVCVRL
jgi:2-C-methyl-D-erythritol 4-phosphate cytidylyltransferase/2-C-methyl-D-erythritol 2,4-cyclodiphosphate synthase